MPIESSSPLPFYLPPLLQDLWNTSQMCCSLAWSDLSFTRGGCSTSQPRDGGMEEVILLRGPARLASELLGERQFSHIHRPSGIRTQEIGEGKEGIGKYLLSTWKGKMQSKDGAWLSICRGGDGSHSQVGRARMERSSSSKGKDPSG